MLRLIVGSSLRFRHLVVALSAGLIFFGVGMLGHSQVDVFPEFAPPRVEVQTPSLGLSASQVESLVTVPLEQSLIGIPRLETIRSKSVEQLSSILLIFERDTDLLTARQLVAERLAVVTPTLPTWSSPLHDPATVGNEPRAEDRPHVHRSRCGSHGHVDDGVLEDPVPLVARARRGQRAHLG